ncbi:ATP-grasp domain-containing protein [Streptomyces sp.]|uniref:ATP-grasp domain-containing protein n=1 Tax=Streptomyces sp. TaxID=1931 RepID=UPI002F41A4F3
MGGRPDTVRKAAALGIDVVLVQHHDHLVPEVSEWARAVFVADYTDWEAVQPVLAKAHGEYGFTKAITLTEPGLEPVGRINDLFGLGGTSYRTAHLLKDKLAMRRHLTGLGGAAAAVSVAAAEAADEDAIRAFGAEHGFPIVVKPADITASLGVHKVDSADQIPAVWRRIEELRARTDLPWGSFFTVGPHVVEQYIEGPEYSVEAFSFAGRHVVVAITEKLTDPNGFIELGHAQPARLDPDAARRVEECAVTLLDAVGLRDGASHTEVKLTADGPKIIEGHNRIGGDRIVDLLEAAYGVDFELLTVGVPFGLCEPLPARPPLIRAAATRFLGGRPGTVTAVEGDDTVREHAGVLALDITVAPGTVVDPGSNWGRCGQVIAVGEDTGSAVRLCEEMIDAITIRIDPVAEPSAGPAGDTGEEQGEGEVVQ